MKKIISAIILTFMLSGILAGCADNLNKTDGDNGNSLGSGEGVGGTNGESEAGKTEVSLEDNATDASEGGESGTEDENNAPEDDEGGALGENTSVSDKEENTDKDLPTTPAPAVGTAVGDRFADVTLESLNGGEAISTSEYRGRIIILNIWATWCPPCKAELPDFDKIAAEYGEDVAVIAAHVPSGKESAPSYVQTNLPDSNIVFAYDTDRLDAYSAAGGEGGIPRTIIIDRDGIILYGHTGMMSYEQLKSIIEQAK